MSQKGFILSCAGFKNVIFTSNADDCVKIFDIGTEIPNQPAEEIFDFHINSKIIRMNRILAEFISPRVFHMHCADLTLNSLELNLSLKKDENLQKLIENFVKISKGICIHIDKPMSQQLLNLSILLGNEEMYHSINSLFEKNEEETAQLMIDQYIEYIEHVNSEEQYFPLFAKETIIDDISSHFYLIENRSLKKLSKKSLYLIICNPNLKIKNEDSLLDIINEVFLNDNDPEIPNKMLFYEQIVIENLSPEKKKKFFTEINSSDMTEPLWRLLYQMLIKGISNEQNNTTNEFKTRYFNKDSQEIKEIKEEKVEYDSKLNHRFEGILFKLGNGRPMKAREEGIIDITASSIESRSEGPENALDFESNSPFVSDHIQNSWLCIDFKNQQVKPTHYSIKSFGDKGYYKPQTWCVEGSNDNMKWEIIDKREEDKSLDVDAINTFEIKDSKKYYQYLRIRQTGVNTYKTNNDHRFVIKAIEYFGSIKKKS